MLRELEGEILPERIFLQHYLTALVTLAVAGGGQFLKRADVAPIAGDSQQRPPSSKESSYQRRSKAIDENALRFMEAVIAGDTGKVRELIAGGVDVNAKMEISDWVALPSAASAGHTEIVRMLLDAGADLNANGGAALTTAAGSGHTEVVRVLVEKGADVNAKRVDGLTPLMTAAGGGNVEIVKLLLERGADLHVKMPDGGQTPLFYAAQYGSDAEVIRTLLNAGAPVESRDLNGETALMLAAREGNLTAVRALIASGADVNAKSVHTGATPLIIAAAGSGSVRKGQRADQRPAVIKTLVAAGADVNAKQKGNYTALMFAAQEGNEDAAQLLLDAGAHPNAKNDKGDTAASLAKRNGKLRTLQ